MVSAHEDSFWHRGKSKLENGLLTSNPDNGTMLLISYVVFGSLFRHMTTNLCFKYLGFFECSQNVSNKLSLRMDTHSI